MSPSALSMSSRHRLRRSGPRARALPSSPCSTRSERAWKERANDAKLQAVRKQSTSASCRRVPTEALAARRKPRSRADGRNDAEHAHRSERLPKLRVAGSNPVVRFLDVDAVEIRVLGCLIEKQ